MVNVVNNGGNKIFLFISFIIFGINLVTISLCNQIENILHGRNNIFLRKNFFFCPGAEFIVNFIPPYRTEGIRSWIKKEPVQFISSIIKVSWFPGTHKCVNSQESQFRVLKIVLRINLEVLFNKIIFEIKCIAQKRIFFVIRKLNNINFFYIIFSDTINNIYINPFADFDDDFTGTLAYYIFSNTATVKSVKVLFAFHAYPLGIIEKLYNLLIGFITKGLNQKSCGKLLFSVNSGNNMTFRIHLKLEPGSTIRDYPGVINTIRFFKKEENPR